MKTKDDYLPYKDKKKSSVDNISDDQYSNLNLNNQNHPYLFFEILQSDNVANDRRIFQNYDVSHSNGLQAKKDSNSWNKSNKNVSKICLNRNQDFGENCELKKGKSTNSSTLSLHIAAYENSIEASNHPAGREKETAQKRRENFGLVKKLGTSNHFIDGPSSIIQNQFEFPRQEEDKASPPELMQFTASQRLLNPNLNDANNQTDPPKLLSENKSHSNSFAMENGDFLNTPGTSSNDSCLSTLEMELESTKQKAFLKERHIAEELVKLCSSISVSNITSKVEDLRKYLEEHDESCRRWLAQHLILRWIPLKQSSQFLYHNFFKILNDDDLNDCIKEETFRSINILLGNKTKREYSNTGERTILRNYGHWLGLITVASDVPILLDELDLASILLYAYTTGEQVLVHVAPFVAEVLLASTRSRLFKASCSWLRPIYLLFADLLRRVHDSLQDFTANSQTQLNIHVIAQIKQQIKEIGGILKLIDEQNSLAEGEIEPPVVIVHSSKPLPEPHYTESMPIHYPLTFAPQFYFHEINLFGDYPSSLEIPTTSPFFQFFPALERQTRQLFTRVVMEAIKEICRRSFPLSVPLSAGLIKAHLSQFQDENDLRLTALTTVRSLTSAVALLHAREFLPIALMDAIQKLFTQYVQQFENPRQTFLNMVNDALRKVLERNLEYAICYVIKSACNQSMTEINKKIKENFKVDGEETNENIIPKVQEMLDKLPPELSRNLTAKELCSTFPNYIFGFKQAAASISDVKKWIPTDNVKLKIIPPPSTAESIKEKYETIFNEWVSHCSTNEQPIIKDLLSLLSKYEIKFEQESIANFIRMCLQICAESSYKLLAKHGTLEVMAVSRGLCYFTVDAFTKLACLVIKSGTQHGINNYKMLHIVLEIFSVSLVADHDNKQAEFNGLPFLRILMGVLEEFSQVAANDAQIKIKILATFKRVLLYIQPSRAPAFAFHWLEIIGHRKFIRIYLADSTQLATTGVIYEQLLIAFLKFLSPCLQTSDVSKAIKKLYEGTLRLMAILLHDFPDFICEYYFSLCDVIPSSCIQLRNVVLSAFPKTMKPPEPFSTPFNTLESIPDMQNIPEMSTQIFGYIPADARQLINFYSADKPQKSVILKLVNVFRKSIPNSFEYNVPLLNAFVSFVGYRAAAYFKEINENISVPVVEQHASMDIFQNLAVSFCSEGRYLLFNAIVNQLRYPSALTHYFACIIFSFFKQTNDNIKEQITHILFERLAAFRPHPWGLFITFIELIKNKQYKFWSYDFIHRYPDIRALLFTVAKKCNATIPDEYLKR